MQRIDRHNYEEFFILYLDNELSAEQRRQVEAFLEKHPDLQTELDALSQYKLMPELSVVFEEKEQLYREEILSDISLNNCQEWMLLYVDDELTSAQKMNFEQFLVKNPELKHELDTLLLARFKPEAISFAGKELLYKITINRPAFPVSWWRAAAILLIILLAGASVLIFNNKRTPEATNLAKQPIQIPGAVEQQQATVPVTTSKEQAIITKARDTERLPVAREARKEQTKLVITQQKDIVTDNPRSNNLPVPVDNPNATQSIAVNTTNENKKQAELPSNETADVTNNSTPPSNVINASLTYDAVDQPDGKKNKLRGLFRKLTRTVEKTTNVKATDDDERLLIGGLAIRLK